MREIISTEAALPQYRQSPSIEAKAWTELASDLDVTFGLLVDSYYDKAGLFGISHGYQGLEACVKIAIGGALFGLLALWRSSLRPGIVAHAGTDILGGIFGL
jgi:hypothetical protein